MTRPIGKNLRLICATIERDGPLTAVQTVAKVPEVARAELTESIAVKANRAQKYLNRAVKWGFLQRVHPDYTPRQEYQAVQGWQEKANMVGRKHPLPNPVAAVPKKPKLRNSVFDV